MGDLVNQRFRVNHSCVVKSLNNTPLFWRGYLLSDRASRFENRADNGRSRIRISDFLQPLLRRGTRSRRPPVFRKPFPVWRCLRARQADQGAIRARMALEKIVTIPNEFRESS